MKTIIFIICLFTGAASSAQLQYHWRQYSGPLQTTIVSPDSATTLVTGLNQQGTYGYEFSVTNEFGTGRDSCFVHVISGKPLSIPNDTSYQITRPEITKLEIKMIVRASDIYVQIKSPRQQEMKCMLYDVVGRPIAQIVVQIKQGNNFISIPKPQVRGVYIIRFSSYFDNVSKQVFI